MRSRVFTYSTAERAEAVVAARHLPQGGRCKFLGNLREGRVSSLPERCREQAQSDLERVDALGGAVVTFLDEAYPRRLRSLPDLPLGLFVLGDLSPLNGDSPCVALVGTRRSSRYGDRVAAELTTELVRAGAVVISGLAYGIDSRAHRAAIAVATSAKVSGTALSSGVAVLASGLDRVSPAGNLSLARDLVGSGGVLLTEYAPGTDAARHTFPERNRLISGLSDLVIVVEAGERSGACLTARLAAEQGREVFAVPGPVTSAVSVGTNRLIRDGAGVLTGVADIFEVLPGLKRARSTSAAVSEGEGNEIICLLRARGKLHVDDLAAALAVPVSQLTASLTRLELAGNLYRLPGDYFVADDFIDT